MKRFPKMYSVFYSRFTSYVKTLFPVQQKPMLLILQTNYQQSQRRKIYP